MLLFNTIYSQSRCELTTFNEWIKGFITQLNAQQTEHNNTSYWIEHKGVARGVLGCPWPPLCKPFCKEITYNIQVTIWWVPSVWLSVTPLWKSWLRPWNTISLLSHFLEENYANILFVMLKRDSADSNRDSSDLFWYRVVFICSQPLLCDQTRVDFLMQPNWVDFTCNFKLLETLRRKVRSTTLRKSMRLLEKTGKKRLNLWIINFANHLYLTENLQFSLSWSLCSSLLLVRVKSPISRRWTWHVLRKTTSILAKSRENLHGS